MRPRRQPSPQQQNTRSLQPLSRPRRPKMEKMERRSQDSDKNSGSNNSEGYRFAPTWGRAEPRLQIHKSKKWIELADLRTTTNIETKTNQIPEPMPKRVHIATKSFKRSRLTWAAKWGPSRPLRVVVSDLLVVLLFERDSKHLLLELQESTTYL